MLETRKLENFEMSTSLHRQRSLCSEKIDLDIDLHVFMTFPTQPLMVTSAENGRAFLTVLSGFISLSNDPPLHGIVIPSSRASFQVIKNTGCFIVNIPGKDLLHEIMKCGRTTSLKTDMFKHANLTPFPSSGFDGEGPPRIAECIAHVEYELCDVKSFGDQALFVGEVVACSANGDTIRDGIYCPVKAEIPLHLGGHEFCSLDQVLPVNEIKKKNLEVG